jgi:hypothetical protein
MCSRLPIASGSFRWLFVVAALLIPLTAQSIQVGAAEIENDDDWSSCSGGDYIGVFGGGWLVYPVDMPVDWAERGEQAPEPFDQLGDRYGVIACYKERIFQWGGDPKTDATNAQEIFFYPTDGAGIPTQWEMANVAQAAWIQFGSAFTIYGPFIWGSDFGDWMTRHLEYDSCPFDDYLVNQFSQTWRVADDGPNNPSYVDCNTDRMDIHYQFMVRWFINVFDSFNAWYMASSEAPSSAKMSPPAP